MDSRPLTARFVCPEHRDLATEGAARLLTWSSMLALSNDLGVAGRTLRSVVHGTRGVVDIWRNRNAVRADHDLTAALVLALRTGCDSRDIAALKKCARKDLSLLYGIVPRARRAEYRDWNNCAVGAARVNDKLLCGRRLRDAGIKVATQFSIGSAARIRPGRTPRTLDLSYPPVAPGTQWMLKDRHGLQGAAVWKAIGRAEPSGADTGATSGDSVLAATVMDLARQGRLMAEELLDPEEWFAEAGDSALPTVRLVTSMLRGPAEVIGLVLFRGGPGAVAANRRQGGTAHVVTPDGACGDGIDQDGARRGPCGYRFARSRLRHLGAMCVEAHRLFPCVGSVGWDVGLSDRGPFLLEGNANWGMNVPQLMPGRPMLAEFQRSRFRAAWFAGRG